MKRALGKGLKAMKNACGHTQGRHVAKEGAEPGSIAKYSVAL